MVRRVMFRDRRAATIENDELRLTVVEEGGHIAEVFDKRSGISPLWVPSWRSIEPSQYDPGSHPEYGSGTDARLLAGIMGHNLCLDIFGGPSDDEARAGLTAHGEAPIARYDLSGSDGSLTMRAVLPQAQLEIKREVTLERSRVRVREEVHNLAACDRPAGWTQHVTLGPPFVEQGRTQIRASVTRSKVFEGVFGRDDYLEPGACFDWPHAPRKNGGTADLSLYTNLAASSAYSAHLVDAAHSHAFFVSYSPTHKLAFGYIWLAADFPWLGIWEENHSRLVRPWNGSALALGLEFGASPIPESRRQMIGRATLFDVPTFRWFPARATVSTEYWIVLRHEETVPDSLSWPLESP